jgi:hypothetical protein
VSDGFGDRSRATLVKTHTPCPWVAAHWGCVDDFEQCSAVDDPDAVPLPQEADRLIEDRRYNSMQPVGIGVDASHSLPW